ncbi:MAG: FHA domain-containing protein, partial [Thermoleophilaceae bacterium]
MTEAVFVEQAPSEGMEHRVVSEATVGREGCDITLGDPDVSRRHAEIRLEDDGVSIEDLGSTNGTYVNGERIGAPRRLQDGDEVKLGSTVWRLRAPAGATRLVQTQEGGATKLAQTTTLRPASAPEPPTEERAPAAAEPPAAPAPA